MGDAVQGREVPEDEAGSLIQRQLVRGKFKSSEVVECLINSDLPTMSQSLSGVRPAEDMLMHETGANIVSSLLDQMLSSVLARAPSLQANLPI